MGIFIDCVKSPPVAAMRAAGVTGVSRYLSTLNSDPLGKIIRKAEYDALIEAGFDVVLNWEHSARDWLGGAAAGRSHASQAASQARALGYPAGCVIVGSADFNMTATQWSSAGKAYAQAYSAGIRAGGYTPGVYGPWDVLSWVKALGGFAVYWQAGMSTAWSGGRNRNAWPGAHLRQRRRATIGGTSVDVSDILQAQYGQAPLGDEMTKDEHDMLAAIHAAVFLGGASMGPAVPAADRGPDSVTGNALVDLLQHSRKVLDGFGSLTGLTDADREAIQKLTDAVTALNDRMASP